MAAKRAPRHCCQGTTKSGKQCRAAALKGSKFCSAHDPNRPDSTRFGSATQAARAGASEKPRRLSLKDELNRRIAEEADRIVAVLFDGLDASRGVTIRIGQGQDTLVETPDHAARVAAAKELLDRGIGKAKVISEISGPGGGPVVIDVLGGRDPASVSPAARKRIERELAKEKQRADGGDDGA